MEFYFGLPTEALAKLDRGRRISENETRTLLAENCRRFIEITELGGADRQADEGREI